MFCLNYYPAQNYLNQVDQLKIFYNPSDKTLGNFLKEFHTKSIVIDVTKNFGELDAKIFKEYNERIGNFKLIIDYNNEKTFQLIKKYKIPFFFSNFVSTIDQLNGLIKHHPTDMYICEELGFSLKKINVLLHNNNIKVRVIPNICQSSFRQTPSIKTFFIRPEDIPIYQEFVDIFQLIIDQDRQRVLYKIYNNHKWLGPINEIIPTFKDYLDNRFLLKGFGQMRSRCGKRCMLDPNSCNVCGRLEDLTNTFQAFHIVQRD